MALDMNKTVKDTFGLIKTHMLQNANHICSIMMNSNGAFIDGIKIDKSFNSNLLCRLCDENGIDVSSSHEDGSIQLYFYVNEKKKMR